MTFTVGWPDPRSLDFAWFELVESFSRFSGLSAPARSCPTWRASGPTHRLHFVDWCSAASATTASRGRSSRRSCPSSRASCARCRRSTGPCRNRSCTERRCSRRTSERRRCWAGRRCPTRRSIWTRRRSIVDGLVRFHLEGCSVSKSSLNSKKRTLKWNFLGGQELSQSYAEDE